MENKAGVLLAFLAGVAIGANAPKIRKALKPYMGTLGDMSKEGLHSLLGAFVAAKEHVDDVLAGIAIKKAREDFTDATPAKAEGAQGRRRRSAAPKQPRGPEQGAAKRQRS